MSDYMFGALVGLIVGIVIGSMATRDEPRQRDRIIILPPAPPAPPPVRLDREGEQP